MLVFGYDSGFRLLIKASDIEIKTNLLLKLTKLIVLLSILRNLVADID